MRRLSCSGVAEFQKLYRAHLDSFLNTLFVPDRLANTVFAWAAEVCPVAGPLKRERRRKPATPSA